MDSRRVFESKGMHEEIHVQNFRAKKEFLGKTVSRSIKGLPDIDILSSNSKLLHPVESLNIHSLKETK
jgi:hypothetical protein